MIHRTYKTFKFQVIRNVIAFFFPPKAIHNPCCAEIEKNTGLAKIFVWVFPWDITERAKLFGQLNIMSVQVSSHSQCGVMIAVFKAPRGGAACWGPSVSWSLVISRTQASHDACSSSRLSQPSLLLLLDSRNHLHLGLAFTLMDWVMSSTSSIINLSNGETFGLYGLKFQIGLLLI